MKKLFAMLMAVVMIFSLATVAFATDADVAASDAYTTSVKLYKLYTTVGQVDAKGVEVEASTLFPEETLTFEVKYVSGPDAEPEVTVASLDVEGMTGEMAISLPAYDTVGKYVYEISEVTGNTQGVTYAAGKITVTVLVNYNENHDKLESTVYLTQTTAGEDTSASSTKTDTFNNKYEVGHLSVNKTVSGNLASQDAYFTMTVAFVSDQPVASDIIIAGGSKSYDAIEWESWTANDDNTWTYTATIELKHDDTIYFYNIPAGVSYTVSEDDKHKLAAGETLDANSAADEDYTCTATGTNAGTIAASATAKAGFNNDKDTEVETGIVLDSMPYVVILAVACFGMFAMMTKKRYEV